jgi:hypothetical protein
LSVLQIWERMLIMARKYFTLLERLPGELWAPQFGDYDRNVVAQEGDDMKNSGSFIKGTKLKIICTDGSQKAINDEVMRINQSIRITDLTKELAQ